jgi:multidrug resistance efflux pump
LEQAQPVSEAPRKTAPPAPAAATPAAPAKRRGGAHVLITLATVAVAAALGWVMWDIYMVAPWTRDGTVRAYVVTMAPEVTGRIVELHVADNQYVHKGDLLMVIDPINYTIAVAQAEAAVAQAVASVENVGAQLPVQEAQISASEAQLDSAQAALVFAEQQASRFQKLSRDGAASQQDAQQFTSQLHQQEAQKRSAQGSLTVSQRQIETLKAQRLVAQASLAQAEAQLHQAKVDLERTQIISPVDGYVTNLLVQLGDFAKAGANAISIVDAHSFWVDGYFEETKLAPIRVGNQAEIKLMGYGEIIRGHVDSIARAISVANAMPNSEGVANVNPIFTWVRLAQRIPVRIHIDEVPPDIVLSAGMTATVQIDGRPQETADNSK